MLLQANTHFQASFNFSRGWLGSGECNFKHRVLWYWLQALSRQMLLQYCTCRDYSKPVYCTESPMLLFKCS